MQEQLLLAAEYLSRTTWGTKQTNQLDSQTSRLVYSGIKDFAALLGSFQSLGVTKEVQDYGVRRWFNFEVSEETKNILLENSIVTPHPNLKHKTIDIFINGIPFDLKGSVFPRKFKFNNNYLTNRDLKYSLIEWLYNNQSSQGRFHLCNRLFIVYHSSNTTHDYLKANLSLTRQSIENWLSNFNKDSLLSFKLGGSESDTYSDIIWVTN